jgi:hypothetical protein
MADQLAKMLPADAITLARKALNLARGAEHDQHRERRGNTLGF